MHCYRHPKTEATLRCGKCDRPICTRCLVSGPAGMRCPDCASLRQTALYQIPPGRLALAAAGGLATGIIGAILLAAVGFFVFFLGPLYGTAVAEVVLRAAGRKRGRALEVIGVGSILVGAAIICLPALLGLLARPAAPTAAPGLAVGVGFGLIWPLIGYGLAISACFARLRYF